MGGAYKYVAWLVVTSFMIYAFALTTAASVFAGPIQKALQLSSSEAALAMSFFTIGFAIMQIPLGILLDRFNNKVIIGAAIIVLASGSFFTTLSSNLAMFAIANVIMGFGAAFGFTATGKTVATWFTPEQFPVIFGLSQLFSCLLAGIIHMLLVSALAEMGWVNVYILLSLIGAGIFGLFFFLFKNKKIDSKEQEAKKSAPSISVLSALKQVVTNQQIWMNTIVVSAAFGALMAFGGFWYVGIMKYYHVSETMQSFTGIMIFSGIGIGTPLWGMLANKFKSKKMVMHVTTALGGIFMIMALYLPHFDIDTQAISLFNHFCIGFFLSGSMLTYALATEAVAPELSGLALGFVNMFVFVVNTMLMSLPNLVNVKNATFMNTHWVFPVFVLVAMLFLYFIKEKGSETDSKADAA